MKQIPSRQCGTRNDENPSHREEQSDVAISFHLFK